MIHGMRVLCVVPVRGGSKGLPGKNKRLLAGRPLVQYTFDVIGECGAIDRTIVSTDDPDLADIAREVGLDVPFVRPGELATDTAGTIDVLLHAMHHVQNEEGGAYDIVLLLQATSPLRTAVDVHDCLDLVARGGADSAFTVSPAHSNPYFSMVEIEPSGNVRLSKTGSFTSRQSAPAVFDINGAVYAWAWDALACTRAVVLPGSRVVLMPKERSVDIDDEVDLALAEALLVRSRASEEL